MGGVGGGAGLTHLVCQIFNMHMLTGNRGTRLPRIYICMAARGRLAYAVPVLTPDGGEQLTGTQSGHMHDIQGC